MLSEELPPIENIGAENKIMHISELDRTPNRPKLQFPEILIGQYYSQILTRSDSSFEEQHREGLSGTAERAGIIRTNHFLQKLSEPTTNDSGLDLNLMPMNCRFNHNTGTYRIYVMEDAPAMRNVQFSLPLDEEIEQIKKAGRYELAKPYIDEILKNTTSYDGKTVFTLSLQFPYVIYFIVLENKKYNNYGMVNFSVYFRNAPLSSLIDPLYYPPLTNQDGGVCLGNLSSDKMFEPEDDSERTPMHKINNILMSWWSNIFNTDLSGHYDWYKNNADTPFSNFLMWNYFSQKDPMFIYSAKMRPCPSTLMKRVNEHIEATTRRSHNRSNEESFRYIRRIIEKPAGDSKQETVAVMYSDNVDMNGIYISIGDDVMIDNELHYLDSIKYNSMNGIPIEITFEKDSDGELVTFPYSRDNETYMFDEKSGVFLKSRISEVKPNKIEELELNGAKYKIGDIVKVNFRTVGTSSQLFSEIEDIRKSRDDQIEIKLIGRYYIASSVSIEKVELDRVAIDDNVILEKGKQYFLMQRNSPTPKMVLYDYDGVEISRGHLYAKFRHAESGRSKVVNFNQYDVGEYVIIGNMKEHCYHMILVGTKVLAKPARQFYLNPGNHYAEVPSLNSNNLTSQYYMYMNPSDAAISSNRKFLFDWMAMNQMLDIKGFDFDIHFRCGQEVAFIDWDTPENMLKIQTIVDFESTKEWFNIIIADENGNEMTVPYVRYQDGHINVSHIRRVYREANGFVRGMKVKATEPRIPMFPKSGTYQIEYFVETHDGTPLIMFNNCFTQFLDENFKNKFEVIPVGDKRYNRLKLKPIDLSKFVFQPGDLFVYRRIPAGNGMRSISIQVVCQYASVYFRVCHYNTILTRRAGFATTRKKDMNNRYIPHGIMNPRLAQIDFNKNSWSHPTMNVSSFNGVYRMSSGAHMHMPYNWENAKTPIWWHDGQVTTTDPNRVPLNEEMPKEDIIDLFDDLITDAE